MNPLNQDKEVIKQKNLDNETVIQMVQTATTSMGRSYHRYTEVSIGAAVLAKSGKVYGGSKVEFGGCNALHAERMALANAASAGDTAMEAIAVATDTDVPDIPCGSCLDAMKTFEDDMTIFCYLGKGEWYITSLDDELPNAYSSDR